MTANHECKKKIRHPLRRGAVIAATMALLTIGASAAANPDRTLIAPALSSGSLPLPHFGDWMHDGQPDSHSHAATASRVARIQAGKASKPRSAKPAPPGWPS